MSKYGECAQSAGQRTDRKAMDSTLQTLWVYGDAVDTTYCPRTIQSALIVLHNQHCTNYGGVRAAAHLEESSQIHAFAPNSVWRDKILESLVVGMEAKENGMSESCPVDFQFVGRQNGHSLTAFKVFWFRDLRSPIVVHKQPCLY